jgi:hypothetical protein
MSKGPHATTDEAAESLKTEHGNIAAALWSVAIVGVVFALLSLQVFGPHAVPSTLLGSALAVLNLWLIARMVRGFLGGAGRTWAPLATVKLVGLFILLGVILKRGWAEVLPLAFGYAALPLGIVLAQLKSPSSERREN